MNFFLLPLQDWEKCENGIANSLEKLRTFKKKFSQPLPDHHEELHAEQMRCKVNCACAEPLAVTCLWTWLSRCLWKHSAGRPLQLQTGGCRFPAVVFGQTTLGRPGCCFIAVDEIVDQFMDYLEKYKHSIKRYLKAGSKAINTISLKHLHWRVIVAD